MSTAEVMFLQQYMAARRAARTGGAVEPLRDLLCCLPVLLCQSPSEVFCATLSLLPDGGVRADFEMVLPHAHAEAMHAFVGTAVDSIEAIAGQALELAQRLQSKLQEPVPFN